mmetsp:Transcript_22903/g.44674  ORF Transcript_22903/g.44674 Transcript_22903/m.44674 type:complete len:109 (+) Transcript_22903:362-688(+)
MGKLSGVFSLDGSYNQTNVRFRSMKGSEWIFLYPGVILIICAGFLILSCGIKCLALCLDSCCCRGEFADEPSRQKDMVLHYLTRFVTLSISVVMVAILIFSPGSFQFG